MNICGCGGTGRRVRLRGVWETVWVQVPSTAPNLNGFLIQSYQEPYRFICLVFSFVFAEFLKTAGAFSFSRPPKLSFQKRTFFGFSSKSSKAIVSEMHLSFQNERLSFHIVSIVSGHKKDPNHRIRALCRHIVSVTIAPFLKRNSALPSG